MKLTVYTKDVYGIEKVYPICKHAKLLCEIAKTKTMTSDTLSIARQMGYEIQVIPRSEVLNAVNEALRGTNTRLIPCT